MRNTIAAIFIAGIVACAHAQQGYNGPAKSFVAQFWRSIDRIDTLPDNKSRPALTRTEVKVAETHLRHAKTRDPRLDTTAMEVALARVQGRAGDFAESAATGAAATQSTTKFFTRFGEALVSPRGVNENSDWIALAERAVAEFETELDQFLRSPVDEKTVARYESRIAATVSEARRAIAANEQCMNGDVALGEAFRCAADSRKRFAYIRAAAKLYPRNAVVSDVLSFVEQKEAAMGSKEQIVAINAARQAQKVASNRLPPPVLRDVELEREFAQTFSISSPGYDVLKVHITARDWTIDRHPATGAILSRSHSGNIAVREASGKCFNFSFVIEQPYVGGTFAASKRGGAMGHGEMLCENV